MPMVNNIVQSSKKYQEMKKDVDANLHVNNLLFRDSKKTLQVYKIIREL